MKQKRAFCKRLLTALLSVAMVLTSIQMPGASMTVMAAETTSETRSVSYDGTTLTAVLKADDAVLNPADGKTVREVLFFYAVYDSMEAAEAATVGDYFAAAGGANALTAGENGDYTFTGEKAITDGQVVRSNFNVLYNTADGQDGGACPQTFEYYTYKGAEAPSESSSEENAEEPSEESSEEPSSEEGSEDPTPGDEKSTAINFEELTEDKIYWYVGGSSGWGHSEATYTADGTALTINATNAGSEGNYWEIQYMATAGALSKDVQSVVSFDVVSNVNKNGIFKLATTDEGYAFCEKTFTAGTNVTRVSALVQADSDIATKFIWGLGACGETSVPYEMKISNAKIVPATTVADATDKAGLQGLYTTEKAIVDAGNTGAVVYTEETWNAYAKAVTDAGSVLANEKATLSDVFTAYDALTAAKKGLKDASKADVDLGDYVNLEEMGNIQHNATNVKITPNGASVDFTSEDGAWGNVWDWAIQYWIGALDVTAGEWTVEYDIVSTVDKPVYFKVTTVGGANDDTPIIEKGSATDANAYWNLKANAKEHYQETITADADGKIRLFYNLAGGSAAGTVTISNVKVTKKSEYIDLEAKKAEENGIFSWIDEGNSNVVYEVDGPVATFTGSNWGTSNWWSVQWAVQNLPVTKGTWLVEYDIVSTIDQKPVYFKLTNFESDDNDTPIIEKGDVNALAWKLAAGETEHYSDIATITEDGKVRFFWNLAGNGASDAEGTVTISNLKISQAPLKEAPVISTDKVSKENGYVVGNNVTLNFEDDAEWRSAISVVKVANKTLDNDKYTVKAGKLIIDASAFNKQNLYTVEVEAQGYSNTAFTLPVYNPSIDSEVWVEEWRDDFDEGKLDPEKWDYEIGVKSGDDATSSAPIYWGNQEKQFYTKEAVSFDDENLIITATALTDELREKYNITDPTVKYSSARLRTVSEDGQTTLFGTTYGKIEARIALPTKSGYWPAFWMLPTSETADLYGGWPSSGEIDIMEAGQDVENNKIDGTLHYGSLAGHVYKGNSYYLEESEGDFHTYAVEWEPGEIRWYVDGILYNIQNSWYGKDDAASDSYTYPAPYDEDFYILLNLAMEGQYIGGAVPDELGQSMKVDYVEVSKLEGFDYGKDAEKPGAADKDTEFFDSYSYMIGEDGNLLQDSNFDTLPGNQVDDGGVFGGAAKELEYGIWFTSTNTGSGASSTRTVEDINGRKWAKIDVHKQGANVYDVQIFQHVPIAQGYSYRLTFDAYADKDGRTVAFSPSQGGDNGWGSYGSSVAYQLGTTPQTYDYVFTMADASDATTRMEMNVGHDTGAVYFSNFKLVAMTDEELEDYENEQSAASKTPLADGNHIYNGSFNQGTNGLGFWDLAGDVSIDNANRSANITINSSLDIDDASLTQTGLQLLKGEKYKVTFDAKVAENKDIKVGLYSADGYETYGEITKTVTSEDGEVTLEFTMAADTDDTAAVLVIAFGGNTVAVEFDNVTMVRTTNNNADWSADILYPLGNGVSWGTYFDFQYGNVVEKSVPADGIVTEELASDDADNWQHQLFADANVLAGYTYKLSYDVKTSVAAQKVVSTVQQDQTWLDFGTTKTVETTTDWQTIEMEFKPTSEGNIDLKFLLSTKGNDPTATVSIRNVRMTVVDGPYVTITNIPAGPIKVGTKLHLNATHTASVGAEYEVYTYASSNEAVATVKDGNVEALAVGTTTITVKSATGTATDFVLTVVADADAIPNAKTEGLAAKVTEYEKVTADDYTTTTYMEFASAFTIAKNILNEVEAGVVYSQDAVDAALADLEEAYTALMKKATTEQIEALKKAVDEADDYEAKKADYTSESYNAFERAFNDAVTVYAEIENGNCSEAEVAEVLLNLEKAVAGLELKAIAADITVLETAVNNAAGYVEDSHLYTPSSYKAFEVVYNKANKMLKEAKNGIEYGTKTVNDMAEALNEACASLVEKDGLWVEPIDNQIYTGSAIKPAVVVWDGTRQLIAGKDYKVSYKKNTNVGTATVTVTGKGNYNKKTTTTFEIVARDLADEDIVAKDVMATINSNGKVKNPKVTVKHGKKTLGSKDIEVKYPTRLDPQNAKAGVYTITILAKEGGNYTGSTTVNYEVREETLMLSNAKVSLNKKTVTYNGSDTEVPQVTVTYGSGRKKVTLTENEDYYVVYNNYNTVGKNKAFVTVVAEEDSKYYGSKTVKYTVEGRTLDKKNITIEGIDESYPYTGHEVLIDVIDEIKVYDKKNTVKNEETGEEKPYELVPGEDYYVECTNNENAGKKAVAKFVGIGLYAGTISKNFTIAPTNIENYANAESPVDFEAGKEATYNKNGAVPEFSLQFMGEEMSGETDYKVTYSKNKAVGRIATMTIKGKGNFTGTIIHNYTVVSSTDNNAEDVITATAKDVYLSKRLKADKLKTTVTLVETATEKKLKAGTDYDKKVAYFVVDAETGVERAVESKDLVADAIICARITLKGNYAGTGEKAKTIDTFFRLYENKVSSLKVDSIPKQTYTGYGIEPEVTVYADNAKTVKLVPGEDYIVEYSKNINKGTAKATIIGCGNNYGGTKTVTFKIAAEEMKWSAQALSAVKEFLSELFE